MQFLGHRGIPFCRRVDRNNLEYLEGNFNYLNTSVLKSAVRGPVSGLKRNVENSTHFYHSPVEEKTMRMLK